MMGRLAVFFNGECKAGIELTTAVSPAGEEVDISWQPEWAPMSMGSKYF
jgi:hypothetical protein